MIVTVGQFGVDQLLVFGCLLRFGDQSSVGLCQTPEVRVFGVDRFLGVCRVLYDTWSMGGDLQLTLLRLHRQKFRVNVLASAGRFEVGLREIFFVLVLLL